ncbi:MAG: pentapeptide repeat-containing protein, partial [bacterium]
MAERSAPIEGDSPPPGARSGDSPAGAADSAPHRFGRPATQPRLAPALRFLGDHAATILLGLLAGASVPAAWLGGIYRTGGADTLALLVQGALFNAFLLALFLDLRERAQRRRRSLERLQRELRYFRTWSGEEGMLRKVGLIRDLNALGAVPEDLQQAALPGADLSGAQLQGVPLREADLRGA